MFTAFVKTSAPLFPASPVQGEVGRETRWGCHSLVTQCPYGMGTGDFRCGSRISLRVIGRFLRPEGGLKPIG
jgi:hypothetical protein